MHSGTESGGRGRERTRRASGHTHRHRESDADCDQHVIRRFKIVGTNMPGAVDQGAGRAEPEPLLDSRSRIPRSFDMSMAQQY